MEYYVRVCAGICMRLVSVQVCVETDIHLFNLRNQIEIKYIFTHKNQPFQYRQSQIRSKENYLQLNADQHTKTQKFI